MDMSQIGRQYRLLLEKDFLPYWFRHIDQEYGGVLNCINNRGDMLLWPEINLHGHRAAGCGC